VQHTVCKTIGGCSNSGGSRRQQQQQQDCDKIKTTIGLRYRFRQCTGGSNTAMWETPCSCMSDDTPML
jgi:hypothetical protein